MLATKIANTTVTDFMRYPGQTRLRARCHRRCVKRAKRTHALLRRPLGNFVGGKVSDSTGAISLLLGGWIIDIMTYVTTDIVMIGAHRSGPPRSLCGASKRVAR
jgi:hypothetical protein